MHNSQINWGFHLITLRGHVDMICWNHRLSGIKLPISVFKNFQVSCKSEHGNCLDNSYN